LPIFKLGLRRHSSVTRNPDHTMPKVEYSALATGCSFVVAFAEEPALLQHAQVEELRTAAALIARAIARFDGPGS
jgi:hypothetical protein